MAHRAVDSKGIVHSSLGIKNIENLVPFVLPVFEGSRHRGSTSCSVSPFVRVVTCYIFIYFYWGKYELCTMRGLPPMNW